MQPLLNLLGLTGFLINTLMLLMLYATTIEFVRINWFVFRNDNINIDVNIWACTQFL